MGEFFHGWRRKVGVLTLVMACVLMGVWFRGQTIQDSYWFGFGIHDSFLSGKHIATRGKVMHAMSSSARDGLVWERTEYEGVSWFGGWHTSDRFSFALFHPGGWDLAPDSKLYHWQVFGFDVGKYENVNYGKYSFCRVSYSSIVLPLTLLSAWLLLSKPRKSTSDTITEPVLSKGT